MVAADNTIEWLKIRTNCNIVEWRAARGMQAKELIKEYRTSQLPATSPSKVARPERMTAFITHSMNLMLFHE